MALPHPICYVWGFRGDEDDPIPKITDSNIISYPIDYRYALTELTKPTSTTDDCLGMLNPCRLVEGK